MIFSGTILLDTSGQAARCQDLRARLADLEERRDAAARTVASLLESWHGAAADGFAEQWRQWDDGAAGVLDALGRSLAAVDLARADLTGADVRRSGASDALAGRLG